MPGRGRSLRYRAHAKLNLTLRIVGRRPDGYHDIETIFHPVDLADRLDIAWRDQAVVEVKTTLAAGTFGDAPPPQHDIIMRAAYALRDVSGIDRGAAITATKRIPIGSGMGGGSADAAAALIGLNELWDLGWERSRLQEVGARVGSDVPYFVHGGTAIGRGRGERLSAISAPSKLWFALGLSAEPSLTPDVYARWDGQSASPEVTERMAAALASGDPEQVGAALHNDLQPAIFAGRPELQGACDAMTEAGALGAAVTGSGPTIFGVTRDAEHARQVALAVGDRFDRVIVTCSQPVTVERMDLPG